MSMQIPRMDWVPVALRCPNEEEARERLWLYDSERKLVILGRYMGPESEVPSADGSWLDNDGAEIPGDIDFWMPSRGILEGPLPPVQN